MRISDKFKNERTVFSFEVFPPKKTSSVETIYNTLDELKTLEPDFISVTYGAGGSAANNITARIASRINKMGVTSAAHLSCVNNTREDILRILDEFKALGIENILALRGDKIPDVEPKKDFIYASDLTAFIKANGDFHVSGACYPEGHFETPDIEKDIAHLKIKVDAGAEHLISQLFFENGMFLRFLDRARGAGINVPIEAGIMPVTNKSNLERMVTICGASIPPQLTKILQKYESDPEALREAGIDYAIEQIRGLIANGADGIHLYTMNNPYVAGKIVSGVKDLL